MVLFALHVVSYICLPVTEGVISLPMWAWNTELCSLQVVALLTLGF